MLKTLNTYAEWGWLNTKPGPSNTRVDTAYFDWLETNNQYVDTMPLLVNVNAHLTTKRQIDKLHATMITEGYPETYLLNHPIARTHKGRAYALKLLNTKLHISDKQLFDKFFSN